MTETGGWSFSPRRFVWNHRQTAISIIAVLGVFAIYAGDAPPAVNEAHYWVKAKNYWNPSWLANDLFASSGKAHAFFYLTFGWMTRWFAFENAVWLARFVGWFLLAWGLVRLTRRITGRALDAVLVACIWIAGIHYANLAGEWIVGGIEAKVPAYGLGLLGLSEIVVRRWSRVWIWLGAASAFHVLTGGWTVVAAMFAFMVSERFTDRSGKAERMPFFNRGLWIGGAFSLAGVIPAALMSQNGDASMAASIYVYDRIPHHLLPANFQPSWYARFGALTLVAMIAVWGLSRRNDSDATASDRRLRRLGIVMIGTLAIAVAGLLLGILPAFAPELAAKWLRYYWFRVSDAFVPLFLACFAVGSLSTMRERSRPTRIGWTMSGLRSVILITGLLGFAIASVQAFRDGVPVSVRNRLLGWESNANRSRQAETFSDWRAVCRWASESTPAETTFLTPRHQQTFKWYAGRSEVVNWKDVPQDAASLVEWKRRFFDVFPPRLGMTKVTIHYDTLRRYRRDYGAEFLIVDRRVVPDDLPLQRVYPKLPSTNLTYWVYELPR